MRKKSERKAKKKTGRIVAILFVLCIQGQVQAEPLEIVDVDASNYPKIRLKVSIKPIHPSFVRGLPSNKENQKSSDNPPRLSVSEIYQNREFPVKIDAQKTPASETSMQAVLVIDATRSLSAAGFRSSKQLARLFLKMLSEKDRSVVYALKARPLLVADVSKQHKEQIEKVNKIKRNARHTRLYDSLYSALYTAHSLSHNPQGIGSKTVVLLFTDAKEESSFLSDNDCLELSKIGKELSIPVYTFLSDATEKELSRQSHKNKTKKYTETEASSKARTTQNRLRRIALKTGGHIWSLNKLIKNSNLRALAFQEIRRPTAFETELFWTHQGDPTSKQDSWPGDKILIRVGLRQGEANYTALADYRVPFGAYMRSEYGSSSLLIAVLTASFIIFLIVLLLIIILASIWMRRLPKDSPERKAKRASTLFSRFTGKKTSKEKGEGFPEEEDSLKNLAGYVGESSDALPQAPLPGQTKTAPILMEDERRLYMREYNYRLLQLALREAGYYERAALVALSVPEIKKGRRYDLFLESTVIGSGRWANIPLHDNTASPIHAKIKRVENRYVIYDMLSAGGVYQNGKKLLRPRGLRNGDEIRIGRSKFRFDAQAKAS